MGGVEDHLVEIEVLKARIKVISGCFSRDGPDPGATLVTLKIKSYSREFFSSRTTSFNYHKHIQST